MSNAVSGHGASIAMELDPTGAPGVFTAIAEINGDIMLPTLSRETTESTPHEDTVDYHVTSPVLRRSTVTMTLNYIFDDSTHDSSTGLKAALTDRETRGYRIRGPGGTTDSDEWIGSAEVISYGVTNPVRTGIRSADVELIFSGPYKEDGTIYS